MKEMKDRIYWILIALIGALFMAAMSLDVVDEIARGENDFIVFYTGAKLVGTPDLYDRESNYAAAEAQFGEYIPSWRYIRPPFHAALLWPLGKLPYKTAYAVWCALNLSAFALFLALWRTPSREISAVAMFWSLPAAAAMASGQDSVLLAALIAAAAAFEGRGKGFIAGAVLALLAVKAQFFALIPLLLIAQRRTRMLKGFFSMGAALTVLSFAAAGIGWPAAFLEAVFDPKVHPHTTHMPNLHGLLAGLPGDIFWEAAAACLVVAAAWRFMRAASFEESLAAALLGGFLISYHAHAVDTVILLPAILIVATKTQLRWMRGLAIVLLSPLLMLALVVPRPVSYIGQLLLVAFFVGAVFPLLKRLRGAPAETAPDPSIGERLPAADEAASNAASNDGYAARQVESTESPRTGPSYAAG